ncbi:methyl farnesoate epoxidase-like [Nylanderia fulva]|uniref:methyl farnesoate epoxidase-like n=1 Tax=Nylanderia fulva TaxID=613905 RepID=UPI0010FB8AA2|nr:methyl farnesoate epoxidase-like [Nylanderia fulva]XP_029164019.1 methyl farnesoate epoxidase-like [Nylanderia fulva]XP_029164020.1 methyl farnesoate epoxidase-like [Nylanderia fulva]
MLYLTILLLLLTFICLYCLYDCVKPKNYPPGPAWLPFLGCLIKFMRLRSKCGYIYLVVQELARIYGPILGLKLGNQKVVVISTHDLVKKVILREEFNGRPDGFFFRVRSFGKRKGILFTEDNTWTQCRRFTTRHLRMFGLGQTLMKDQLVIEARELVDHLQKLSEHGPVLMHTIFDIAVLNALWFMIAGHRFDYEDQKVQEVLVVVHDVFRLMDPLGGVMSQMPFLRFVIPEQSGYNELMRIHKKIWGFLDEEIKMHENEPSDNPRDLIDAFLLEMSNKSGDEDTIFDRENLMILCLDLFLAGSKTTTDTLATTFLFLSVHPEWLKLLQIELDGVVGRSRAPVETDLPYLPMTEAFLAEVQRYLILAPLGVPHRATKDVFLDEYLIPKDTIMLFDFHSVHNDNTYWEEPDVFRPQRFLDEQGQFRRNNNSLPFGLGKRRCPGELLARSSLFMLFTNVVHYFNMEIAAEYGEPDLNAYDGFTLSPKPYYLKLTRRSD